MERSVPSIVRAVVILTCCLAGAVRAEIPDSSAAGFTVRDTAVITAPPSAVYTKLVANIGEWWSSEHTFSGDARNLSLDARAGGLFSEKLKGGGSVQHMTVVYADPGVMLRLVGGLGPFQALAATGSMTWSLAAAGNGTSVELIYTVGGYRPGGMQALAVIVDSVLREQLLRLKNYCEHGTP